MIVYQPYTAISCCPPQFNSIHCMRSMMWETALLGSVAFSSPWSPWWEVFCIRTVILLSPHKKDACLSLQWNYHHANDVPRHHHNSTVVCVSGCTTGGRFTEAESKPHPSWGKSIAEQKDSIITWPRTWKSNHQGGLLCPEFFSPTATATATTTTSVSTKYHCTSRPTKIHKPKSPQNQNQNQ